MTSFFGAGSRNSLAVGIALFLILAMVGNSYAIEITNPQPSRPAERASIGMETGLGLAPRSGNSNDNPVLVHPRRLPHSVLLRWNGIVAVGGSENALAGYNVYRRTIGTPYQIINSSVIAVPRYVDFRVKAGITYFYYTTAVTAAGVESGPSNITKVVIPYP